MNVRVAAALVLTLAFGYGHARQDGQALPDAQMLFDATRAGLARAQREQRFFAYKERRTELRTNPFGRLGTGPTRVYDVVPVAGGGFTRRLLERDGKPVADAEVEKIAPRNRGGRRPNRSALDDAIGALDLKVDRRERENGRSLIVVTFEPRADAMPETREGRMARYFKGEVRIDERQHEVARIDATAIDDISYGLGLLARLQKGSVVSVVREQIEPNLWLPVSVKFQGQGRALLFRKLNVDYNIEWWDYRRVAFR